MDVNEYQKSAMTTLNPTLDRKDVLINSVMGLCGESGEAMVSLVEAIRLSIAVILSMVWALQVRSVASNASAMRMGLVRIDMVFSRALLLLRPHYLHPHIRRLPKHLRRIHGLHA